LTVRQGNPGDDAVNDWIADMMSIYRMITGKEPATSVGSPDRPNEGIRPEIPLHTNASENNIRCQVTKRKVSGGTRSNIGRDCRDAFLGLNKNCAKLGIAFWDYLGSRLAVPSQPEDRRRNCDDYSQTRSKIRVGSPPRFLLTARSLGAASTRLRAATRTQL
jgi:hypothetical protein